MPQRPSMHARDSSGRRVSLLNDEPTAQRPVLQTTGHSSMSNTSNAARSNSSTSIQSSSASPGTPALLRSDSYDSQATSNPRSPITPDQLYGANQPTYPTSTGLYKEPLQYDQPYSQFSYEDYREQSIRQSIADQRTSFYGSRPGEEELHMDENGLEKSAKRYPCRYRDSHGCEKTFTTSGHASRHSKIHTAEKAVHCTHENCTKKFTRSDNMKQHLETHNKEKDRHRGPSHKPSSSKSGLTISAGVKKPFPGKRATHSPSQVAKPEFPSANGAHDMAMHNSQQMYPAAVQPAAYGAFEMGGFCNVLMSRPMPARTDRSNAGLDVLAQVAASVPDMSSP